MAVDFDYGVDEPFVETIPKFTGEVDKHRVSPACALPTRAAAHISQTPPKTIGAAAMAKWCSCCPDPPTVTRSNLGREVAINMGELFCSFFGAVFLFHGVSCRSDMCKIFSGAGR